jgi:holo-[acyl-carrier protein] synthase
MAGAGAGMKLGMDIVQISRIEASLADFGERFVQRLFTPAERGPAPLGAPELAPRLATCFAAKEATLKAMDWPEAGLAWPEMEVCQAASGTCHVQLHGRAAKLAAQAGVPLRLPLSLSHDGNHAVAVVTTTATAPA